MREIQLTQGKEALVDDIDYELISQYNWHAVKSTSGIWYAQTNIKVKGKRTVLEMQRLIMGLKHGDSKLIDHVSRDALDNRRFNLRIASKSKNARNQRKHKDAKYSKYKGVTYQKQAKRRRRWVARIIVNYRQIYLGFFETELEAAQAYDKGARKYFGEYARLNFADTR